MANKIRAGTSGYSYKEWRGTFYPEDVPQADWLSFYASRLPCVEINNTFYRMPKDHVVAAWRDAVPDDFRFVIKASRRISHQHRLKNAEEATGYLVKRAQVLGAKLGAVLIQLPPNMRADLERLKHFQALLPQDLPVAFEFRHESWIEENVEAVLAECGHGLVISHDEGAAPKTLPVGDLLYLRLRAEKYTTATLKAWLKKIDATRAANTFVFFKHEDAGAGPKLAGSFLELATDAPRKAKPPARAAAKPRRRKTKTG